MNDRGVGEYGVGRMWGEVNGDGVSQGWRLRGDSRGEYGVGRMWGEVNRGGSPRGWCWRGDRLGEYGGFFPSRRCLRPGFQCGHCGRSGHTRERCRRLLGLCLRCGGPGHRIARCPTVTCSYCRRPGHWLRDCRRRLGTCLWCGSAAHRVAACTVLGRGASTPDSPPEPRAPAAGMTTSPSSSGRARPKVVRIAALPEPAPLVSGPTPVVSFTSVEAAPGSRPGTALVSRAVQTDPMRMAGDADSDLSESSVGCPPIPSPEVPSPPVVPGPSRETSSPAGAVPEVEPLPVSACREGAVDLAGASLSVAVEPAVAQSPAPSPRPPVPVPDAVPVESVPDFQSPSRPSVAGFPGIRSVPSSVPVPASARTLTPGPFSESSFSGESGSEDLTWEDGPAGARATVPQRLPPTPPVKGLACPVRVQEPPSPHPAGSLPSPASPSVGENILPGRAMSIMESLGRMLGPGQGLATLSETVLARVPLGDSRRERAVDLGFWELLAERPDLWLAVGGPDWGSPDLMTLIVEEVQERTRRYDRSGAYYPPLHLGLREILIRVPFSRRFLAAKLWPADRRSPWDSAASSEWSDCASSVDSWSRLPGRGWPRRGRVTPEASISRWDGSGESRRAPVPARAEPSTRTSPW